MQTECGLNQIHFSAGGSAALRYATAAAGSRHPWRSVELASDIREFTKMLLT